MGVVEEFAKKLKDLRTENGMTLSNLAEKIGVTAQSLSFYERGMRTVDINILEKITRVFGVSADYMLGLSEAFSLNTDIQAICKHTGLKESCISNICELKDSNLKLLQDFILTLCLHQHNETKGES